MRLKTKVITAAVILMTVVLVCSHKSDESVAQYRKEIITSLNQELASPTNFIRKKIESAHLTVTSKSAALTACEVRTVDGSDNAGKNGSNVAEVDIVITVVRDGWIQKDGYTEFEVDYDNQNHVVKQTKYLRSSAIINVDDVDWGAVGFTIGEYLAEASM